MKGRIEGHAEALPQNISRSEDGTMSSLSKANPSKGQSKKTDKKRQQEKISGEPKFCKR